jgi:hypothetical protein
VTDRSDATARVVLWQVHKLTNPTRHDSKRHGNLA